MRSVKRRRHERLQRLVLVDWAGERGVLFENRRTDAVSRSLAKKGSSRWQPNPWRYQADDEHQSGVILF
jgi:hypothetical protein